MQARLVSWSAIGFLGLAASCARMPPASELEIEKMTAPELLTQVCAQCHGGDGIAASPDIPHLAAQQPDYIAAQLLNFRDRSRSDSLAQRYMWPIAQRLDDAQIPVVAEMFGRKKPPQSVAGDEAESAAGRKIYFEGIARKGIPSCVMCHGPTGEGFGAFPRLAHQSRNYMANQLRIFRGGQGRPDTPMAAIAPQLSDAEIQSVTTFLQAMPGSP